MNMKSLPPGIHPIFGIRKYHFWTYLPCKHENAYTDLDRFGNESEWCPNCEQQIDDS